MCQTCNDDAEDAAERIRAGQASLADLQTWMAWPVRVRCGPTNEGALRWLLAEVESLTLEKVRREAEGGPGVWKWKAEQYHLLLRRMWLKGLSDPSVVFDDDQINCIFCETPRWEHDDTCPWLVLREIVADDAEVKGE